MRNNRRIIKEPEERKQEILDAAENLFSAKGYEASTVNDILDAVRIAKGTFYYYYKSKEEVLDALVDRRIREGVKKAEEIADSPLPVIQKLLAIIMAQKPQNKAQEKFTRGRLNSRLYNKFPPIVQAPKGLIDVLHEKDNAKMHQKSITQYVLRLSPCLGKVLQEGIDTGIFSAPFPQESAEILLTSALVLFDDDFFKWTKKEMKNKTTAFLAVIERVVGAETGSFSLFAKAFG